MKKLLSATVAVVIGATLVSSLAACGGNTDTNDAEIAKTAVDTIHANYFDSSEETLKDYTVFGQVKVESEYYPITWSVSSATANNIDDYIKVGTMDETSKLVTISVTRPDVAIEYTLTASVTVGSATETTSFNKKVPAKAVEGDGTEAHPYSVSQAVALASAMPAKAKLEESDNPTRVYVTGYIVDCGNSNNSARAGFVKIAESASADKADWFTILSINYGDVLTKFEDLTLGAKITVAGYLMNYQKDANSDTQPELTYFDSNGITCSYLELKEKSDDEKAQAALNAFYVPSNVTQNITVPANITILSSNTAVFANNGTVTRLAEDTEVTLTITATVGTATKTKEITVTVKAKIDTSDGATGTLNMAEYATANNMTNGEAYMSLNIDENVSVTASGTAVGNYSLNTGKYYDNSSSKDGVKNWRIYQTENPSLTFKAVTGYKIVSIKVTYISEKTGVIVFGGTQYASDTVIETDGSTVVLNVGNSGAATNGQVRITAIEVVYAAA